MTSHRIESLKRSVAPGRRKKNIHVGGRKKRQRLPRVGWGFAGKGINSGRKGEDAGSLSKGGQGEREKTHDHPILRRTLVKEEAADINNAAGERRKRGEPPLMQKAQKGEKGGESGEIP